MKQEIRKLLGTDKLIIGFERTLKALKAKKLKQVVLASNCSEEMRAAIEAVRGKAELVKLTEDNDELGVLCKKPFRIAVLGILG